MFNLIDQKNNWYHVRYAGYDLNDLLAFYQTLYSSPKQERLYDNYGYWVAEALYKALCQAKIVLKLSPYSYQQEAIDFALSKQSSLMLLPCGAGKSLIGIASYAQGVATGQIKTPGLIVVKASLKLQWREEIKKFSHFRPRIIETKAQIATSATRELKKTIKKPTKEQIEDAINRAFDAQFNHVDLFVTNYEALMDDDIRRMLHALHIEYIFNDEIQYIKNHKAKRSESLAEFKLTKVKIGASATPIQKDYCDAYGIFSFLQPLLYKSFSEFAARHIKYGGFGKIIGFKNTDALMLKIKPYLFLKTEEDIAKQMPDLMPPIQLWCNLDEKVKIMSNQIFEELKELKEQEKALYAKFKSEADFLNSVERVQLEGKIMALQTFAQELADAPELLEKSDSMMAKNYCVTGKYTNPKLDLLIEKASEIIDSDEKVIIFSKYERMQSIIEERLKKEFKELKVAKVHGGLSPEQRYEQANVLFKDDNKCQVLLASNAIAEGFSAYWCKYLIEYDLADSYAVQTQRHGRIRRANSIHRLLYVYQILARESYDEVALKIVSKKEAMDAELKS